MSNARKLSVSGFSLWIVLAVFAMYFVYPLRQRLRFGIDLVGGTYITLEVQTDKAIESELIEIMHAIPGKLKKIKAKEPTEKKIENNQVVLTFASTNAAQEAASFLRTDDPTLRQTVQGSQVKFGLADAKIKRIKKDAVKSNIEVLRMRLDKMSVAEISIAIQGEKNIIVELPDVSDPQQAKAMIGKAAKLEFKIVDRVGKSEEDILYELDGELPGTKEILPGRDGTYYLVSKYAEVTGTALRDAQPSIGGKTGAEVVVNFKFSPEGGNKFYDLTSKNIYKPLAVVLDGVVITAPRINSGIKDNGQITGMRSSEEAKELALLLKSGAFVAPVTFEEERQIGPSLGAESIRQGFMSCIVGLGLLLIFSLFYYKIAGLFAFIALLFNLLLTLFFLSRIGATLTMPGIAGMVLTVGMAIDASILIYERIKEELAEGLTVKRAVNSGFSSAMKVILDANITTFIVGIVLYKFGTGPIQGFAVTMMLGIISTLITGLFFLRSLFNAYLDAFNVQKLKI